MKKYVSGCVVCAEVSGQCPFCGLDISFGGVDSQPFAAHALPMCKTFEQLNTLEFIVACNQRVLN